MRVGNRTAAWVAALDEMEIHVESAWERLDNGEPIDGTSGVGLTESACTCPVLDGVPVTGSSCPIHGLPAAGLSDGGSGGAAVWYTDHDLGLIEEMP